MEWLKSVRDRNKRETESEKWGFKHLRYAFICVCMHRFLFPAVFKTLHHASATAGGPYPLEPGVSHTISVMEEASSYLEVTLSIHTANWSLILTHKSLTFVLTWEYISPADKSYKDSCEYSIFCDTPDILLIYCSGKR